MKRAGNLWNCFPGIKRRRYRGGGRQRFLAGSVSKSPNKNFECGNFFLIIKVLSMLYRFSLVSSVRFETFMTIRRWEWKLMISRLHRNSDFIPSNLQFRSFILSCEVLCFQRVERCLCTSSSTLLWSTIENFIFCNQVY